MRVTGTRAFQTTCVDFRKPSVFMLKGYLGSSFYGLRGKGPFGVFPRVIEPVGDKALGGLHMRDFFFFKNCPPKLEALSWNRDKWQF